MEIKLNDEQLKNALQEALLLSIPQEARNQMIKEALVNIVTPPRASSYSSEPRISPIQEIYQKSIKFAIEEIIRVEIANDPTIREQVLEQLEPYRYINIDRHQIILTAIVDSLIKNT
jgi:hypothetical protein